jgi:hypothetical protein
LAGGPGREAAGGGLKPRPGVGRREASVSPQSKGVRIVERAPGAFSLPAIFQVFSKDGGFPAYPKAGFVESEKRRKVSYYLPAELVEAVNAAAMAEGANRKTGRVFSPSLIVEAALRAYLENRPHRHARGK